MRDQTLTYNKASRSSTVELVSDGDAADAVPTGDFAGEGWLDPFRSAEVWVPTELFADFVNRNGVDWYGLRFQVGLVPPVNVSVSEAEIRLQFDAPVRRIGAWYPRDEFSSHRQLSSKTSVQASASTELLGTLPPLAEMLPQVKVEYELSSKSEREPQDSVLRTMSDGQQRLTFQLRKDERTSVDPRQFAGQVLFGVDPDADVSRPLDMFTLEVSCTCGVLRLSRTIRQRVEVTFRNSFHRSEA